MTDPLARRNGPRDKGGRHGASSGAWRSPFMLAALCLTVAAAPRSLAQEPISVAEQRVFLDDHLANLTDSQTLEFQFTRSGGQAPFEDHVAVTVTLGGPTRTKSVEADYLTGDRRVELPRIDDAHGNPVILYFFEADIREMSRQTGGSSAYFRKRIRQALAHEAEVQPVHFAFAGSDIAGTQIRIRPFHDDPLSARLKNLAEKIYILTLAPQVAGALYQIRTVTPGADGAAPAAEDRLTFAGTHPTKSTAPEIR